LGEPENRWVRLRIRNCHLRLIDKRYDTHSPADPSCRSEIWEDPDMAKGAREKSSWNQLRHGSLLRPPKQEDHA
jgi:hypothetical protein